MTHGGHYTRFQKGAINRFYEHAETRHVSQLQELVSELFLATDAKKADKLWAKAAELLGKLKLAPGRSEAIVQTRDAKALAELVAKIAT
ncbi:MAG: hypothetical protein SFZ23_05690 [Planctomycetota bacterium]|nr:hypothetical protein [Planctomycetota bacterium]